MDNLASIVQVAATNPVLIFGVASLSVLSLFLTLTVARQRKQLAVLKAPPRRRYGFLGKPLYSVAAMMLLVGGFALTYYATQNTRTISVNADTQIDIQINTEVTATTAEGVNVAFNVVPKIEGVEWGGSNGPEIDAFWTAVGPSGFSQIELSLTQNNLGGFTKVLRSGTYTLTVDLVVGGRRFNKTLTLNF